jgi:hypothetical protein
VADVNVHIVGTQFPPLHDRGTRRLLLRAIRNGASEGILDPREIGRQAGRNLPEKIPHLGRHWTRRCRHDCILFHLSWFPEKARGRETRLVAGTVRLHAVLAVALARIGIVGVKVLIVRVGKLLGGILGHGRCRTLCLGLAVVVSAADIVLAFAASLPHGL